MLCTSTNTLPPASFPQHSAPLTCHDEMVIFANLENYQKKNNFMYVLYINMKSVNIYIYILRCHTINILHNIKFFVSEESSVEISVVSAHKQ